MAKTILVAGYGPGTSNGVAEVFGKQGFQVAIVGRTQAKLDAGVKSLGEKGIKAEAFAADFNDPAAVKSTVGKVREKLGPISVIQWTCYSNVAGDLMTAKGAEINAAIGMASTSLIAAVQAAHEDLKANKGAVLITNGGFLFNDPKIDAMLVEYKSAGLGLANALKHKVAGVLHQQLASEGIFVGELVIQGTVKGTAWDQGSANLDGSAIGQKFWELFQARKDWTINYAG